MVFFRATSLLPSRPASFLKRTPPSPQRVSHAHKGLVEASVDIEVAARQHSSLRERGPGERLFARTGLLMLPVGTEERIRGLLSSSALSAQCSVLCAGLTTQALELLSSRIG